MALDTTHPLYDEMKPDWDKMRDTYGGERAVKNKSTEYLPPTEGMVLDGMTTGQPGAVAYKPYLLRAVFHDYVADAVEAMIGYLHKQPPKIDLPAAMEPLRDRATTSGESLELLLRRINEQQLVTGRVGLMADLPVTPIEGQVLPYIATYVAESIINWDDDTDSDDSVSNLNLVVLNESGFIRSSDFSWEEITKYRVLILGQTDVNEPAGTPGIYYRQGVFETAKDGRDTLAFSEGGMTEPTIMGKKLDQIPFVIINSKDITTAVDDPPLLGLANLALVIYRGEADYRQALHRQGQDTLVVTGGRNADHGEGEAWRVGSGSSIELDVGGSAEFIGVSSEGLPEQRSAIENDKKLAGQKASVMIDMDNRAAESGSALTIRVAARTATLTQLAKAGAAGLEKMLRVIAMWKGLNPEDVVVTPNLDFVDDGMSGQELVQLMTARTLGAPISKESIHDLMVQRRLTKLDYEQELEQIGEEDAAGSGLGQGLGTTAGGNPDPGLNPNDPAAAGN